MNDETDPYLQPTPDNIGLHSSAVPGHSDDLDDLLTKIEIACLFKKTPRTIENWMHSGLIPHIKLGNSVFFSRKAVLRHVQAKSAVRHTAREVRNGV